MLTNTMHQKYFFDSNDDDYEDRTQYNINISLSSVNPPCPPSSRPSSAISSSSSSSFFSRSSKRHRSSNFSISSILTNSPKHSFQPSHNLHHSSSSSILTVNSSSSSSSSVEVTPNSSYSAITPSPAAYPNFRSVSTDHETQNFGQMANNTTITHIQFSDSTALNRTVTDSHTATAGPAAGHPQRPTKRISRPVSNNSNYYTNISNMVCLFWFNDSEVLETAFEHGKQVDFAAKNSTQMAQFANLDFSKLTIPSPSFKQFIMNVIRHTQLPATAVSLALYYILRLKRLSARPIVGNANSEYRVFSVALMLANKFLDDNTFTNKTWAEVTHLPLKEISAMEIEFLGNMNYNLNVDPEDWALWQSRLKVWLNIHSTVLQQHQQQQFTITSTFDPIELHTNKRFNRRDHFDGPNLKKVALSPVIHPQEYHYPQPSIPHHQSQPQLHQQLNRLSYGSQFTMINGGAVLPPPLASVHPPPIYYFQKNKHFEGGPQGPLVLPGVDTLAGHSGNILPSLSQKRSRDGVGVPFGGGSSARPPGSFAFSVASAHTRTGGDVGFSFM